MTVQIGIFDGHVPTDSSTSWSLNKIGGLPDWMVENCEIPVCGVCRNGMHFVLQIYCPLLNSLYHRVLYIFTCIHKNCLNKPHSWVVLRSQIVDSSKQNIIEQVKIETEVTTEIVQSQTNWCDDADDWGDDTDSMDINKLLSTNVTTSTPEIKDMDACHQTTLQQPAQSEMQIVPEKRESEMHCDSQNLKRDQNLNSELLNVGVLKQLNIHDAEDSDTDESSKVVMCEQYVPDAERLKSLSSFIVTGSMAQQTSDNSCDLQQWSTKECLRAYFLRVVEEPSDSNGYDLQHANDLLRVYQSKTGQDVHLQSSRVSSLNTSGDDQYEKSFVKHGDKTFHRFLKRLGVCPEQLVRYDFGGVPLPASPLHPEGPVAPPCRFCAGPMMFELQLVPPLISLLTFPSCPDPVTEFGTILVFTCQQSCWADGVRVRQEHAIVQPDPDSHLFML